MDSVSGTLGILLDLTLLYISPIFLAVVGLAAHRRRSLVRLPEVPQLNIVSFTELSHSAFGDGSDFL